MKASVGTLLIALSLITPSMAWSAEVVQTIDWQELAAAKGLKSGVVVAAPEGLDGSSLRVVENGTAPSRFLLATLDRPAIRSSRYALRGRVRYEGVTRGGYLEMWNHLPDGAFFSRTLASDGPMASLDGSSGWRPFLVPFFNKQGGAPPERLVLNLVLSGPGTVEIGPVELVQFAEGEDPLADSSAWWTGRQAGIAGAIIGSVIGLLGGLIGWLGSTGRAKTIVLGAVRALGWLGAVAAAAGAAAFFLGQPYGVYYPLLLFGAISAALGFALPRSLSRRYEELELRRMQALDA